MLESVRLSKIARAATLLFELPVDRSVGFSESPTTGDQGDYKYKMPEECHVRSTSRLRFGYMPCTTYVIRATPISKP